MFREMAHFRPRGGPGNAAAGAPGFRVIHIGAVASGYGHYVLGTSPAFGRTPHATACSSSACRPAKSQGIASRLVRYERHSASAGDTLGTMLPDGNPWVALLRPLVRKLKWPRRVRSRNFLHPVTHTHMRARSTTATVHPSTHVEMHVWIHVSRCQVMDSVT